MHGKKREEYKAKMRDSKTAKVLGQKAEQWHVLMKELNGRRSSETANIEQTLTMLGKALLVNPDPMNLWNHRRELILQESKSDDCDESKIVYRERALTTTALQRNPKAYGAWFHRKWILQTFKPQQSVLSEELGLTSTFLKADERNFHCWNYRRFVVACLGNSWDGEWTTIRLAQAEDSTTTTINKPLMGQQVVEKSSQSSNSKSKSTTTIPTALIASEFEFTTDKIAQNFSNFSAFHYRSQLLDLCLVTTQDDNQDVDFDFLDTMEERITTEFQLVEDAVCTEPDDQTCWWYHAILLDTIVSIDKDSSNGDNDDKLLSRFHDRLHEQADLFRELLEDSPDSKWVILGLFKVLQVLGNSDHKEEEENNEINENDDDINSLNSKEERDTLLQKLQEIDPYRANRYDHLRV